MKILTIKTEGDIIRLNRSKQVGITYFFVRLAILLG
jgi:porphobilinogen deaminase